MIVKGTIQKVTENTWTDRQGEVQTYLTAYIDSGEDLTKVNLNSREMTMQEWQNLEGREQMFDATLSARNDVVKIRLSAPIPSSSRVRSSASFGQTSAS